MSGTFGIRPINHIARLRRSRTSTCMPLPPPAINLLSERPYPIPTATKRLLADEFPNRAPLAAEDRRGLDQGRVDEGLGEVAAQLSGHRVVLLVHAIPVPRAAVTHAIGRAGYHEVDSAIERRRQ